MKRQQIKPSWNYHDNKGDPILTENNPICVYITVKNPNFHLNQIIWNYYLNAYSPSGDVLFLELLLVSLWCTWPFCVCMSITNNKQTTSMELSVCPGDLDFET